MRRVLVTRWVTTAGAAAALMLVPRVAAQAHAAFVSSTPTPGAELRSAPGVVVVRFSEPLVGRLSNVVVADPTGATWQGQPSGERNLVARTSGSNVPGVYDVRWKTVSPIDGHTLRGSFRFGVGVAPGAGEGQTALSPRAGELAIAGLRAVEYGALLLSVGIVVLRRVARRTPGIGDSIPGVRVPMAVALGAGAAVALGEALVASSPLSPGALGAYFGTVPGALRLLRVALEALVITAVVAGSRGAVAVVLPILALAAAGHAAAARPAWWGIAVDGVHLVSAGLWAGGILALALVLPALRRRHDQGRRELLARFSPVAIGAFLVTVGTGYLRATQELHAVADLYRSPYGRVLSFKVLAVAAMVPLSLLAWRRLVARPRAEALLALVVVAAAAVLAAFPLPPARVAEAGEEAKQGGLASALPQQEDLTLGGYAGQVLVGTTLRPGTPGRNELLLYVLPLEGEEKAGEVRVEARLGAQPVDLRECGPTCRRASMALQGGEVLDVHIPGANGGRAAFSIPSLPAPDAAALAATMQARMAALERLEIKEVLRPANPPVEARYAFEAPDRMHMTLTTGPETVTIGATRYSRKSPAAPWEVSEGIPTTEVPSLIWSPPPFTAPRVVGSDEVEGRPVQVISFFEDRAGTPIWFKLWVDHEGLVRRAEMRAHGHFMDQRYFDFDTPFEIEPPV